MPSPTLAQIIAEVESSGDPYAMRFEPAYTPLQENIMTCSAQMRLTSDATCRIICATSWGLYQIMGDNLYRLGLRVGIIQYLNDLAMQEIMFHAFLTDAGQPHSYNAVFASDTSLFSFARAYNGPGNLDAYVSRMEDAMRHLSDEAV